jgi:serine/threonine-protein kinase HipA
MSSDRLDVFLRSDLVGTLAWDGATRQGTFTYDDTYRAGPDPTPLSLSMPPAAARHRGAVVSAYLWGLLPDNDAVLGRWARQFQVSLSNPMGLLANVGTDLPGAVSIVEPGSDLDPTVGRVEWLTEADVEASLARVRRDQTAWLGADARWSLAGAQAKIALFEHDGRWGRPSGRFVTNRILKPAIAGLDDHDMNEHLCLAAARNLGLRVARTRVMTFGSERAIVIDRFDRRSAADADHRAEVRYHQEDLCQALGVHPGAKYQSDGGPSPVDVVGLLRAHVDANAVERDVNTFVDALIYSWLVAAPDAHAKNYSVLLDGGGVRLAPLYDIASALPYDGVHAPKVKVAMKVGGYYRISSIRSSAWRRLAADTGLDPDQLIERARHLVEQASSAFSSAATELEDRTDPMAARLLDCVAARSVECRAALA